MASLRVAGGTASEITPIINTSVIMASSRGRMLSQLPGIGPWLAECAARPPYHITTLAELDAAILADTSPPALRRLLTHLCPNKRAGETLPSGSVVPALNQRAVATDLTRMATLGVELSDVRADLAGWPQRTKGLFRRPVPTPVPLLRLIGLKSHVCKTRTTPSGGQTRAQPAPALVVWLRQG